FEAGEGHVLDTYLHVQSGRGVNGVLVELANGTPELAHDVAVHIAFGRPRVLTRDEVTVEEVEQERASLEAETRNEGKPEAAVPRSWRASSTVGTSGCREASSWSSPMPG